MTSIGTTAEHQVRDDLTNRFGYAVIRSGGSLGAADLAALGYGEVLLVQVKRVSTDHPGVAAMSPTERRDLLALAARCAMGRPILALRRKGKREPIYRLLTGYGPKDWQPFEPTVQAAE